MRRFLFIAVLAVSGGLGSGCTSLVDGERGLPPFFGIQKNPETGESVILFRPLFGWRRGPEEGYSAASSATRSKSTSRPTSNRPTSDRMGDGSPNSEHDRRSVREIPWEREWVGLWPILRDRVREDGRRSWIFPFYARNELRDDAGRSDIDGFLLPLAFWGSDPVEGNYLLTLPLGGVAKGILGQRRITWFLFPFFGQFRDVQRTANHLLFPIIAWIDGPQIEGFRFFPFFGRTKSRQPDGRLRSDRRFILWPLFFAHDNLLDTDQPLFTRAFLPFYSRTWNGLRTDQWFLWPVFRWLVDEESGERRFQVFPVIDIQRGGPQERTDVWPLFGVKRSEGRFRQFALYPFQQYRKIEDGNNTYKNFWLAPLYWDYRHDDVDQGLIERYRHLYPFVSWRLEEDGSRELRILDLLPFRNDGWWDRTYSRLWQIYRRVDHGDERGRAWEFLWGMVDGEQRPEVKRFRILGGLYEQGRERDDGYVRILWIKFGGRDDD